MTESLVLPPPLMTSEPGSYARYTIETRKPQIIRQVLSDQSYPPEIVAAVNVFRDEIAGSPIRPLAPVGPEAGALAGDVAFWNRCWSEFEGRTWLEIPWFFAETYFYRRLLEAVRYFEPGPLHLVDPFGPQKLRQIESDIRSFSENWSQFNGLDPDAEFERLFHSSLWGNRTDLSNLNVQVKPAGGAAVEEERHLILIDHTSEVRSLLKKGLGRVDIITDNAGIDTIFDLALADFLLRRGWAQKIILRLKNQPYFVSDAMPVDIETTIRLLRESPQPVVSQLGGRLGVALALGTLELTTDPFWTTCLGFYKMPVELHDQLAGSDLVILKGDVNYRRMLDDRHWPHTTRFEDVTPFFPRPYVHLRTLKSEIMIGLRPGEAEALAREDPDWLVDGKRGLIHLVIQSSIPTERVP